MLDLLFVSVRVRQADTLEQDIPLELMSNQTVSATKQMLHRELTSVRIKALY